jgi:hypothetical protein
MKMNGHKPCPFEAGARMRLQGKRIREVRYLTNEEATNMGFYSLCLVIILEDGNWILPMCDDEGNDAGALATSWDKLPTIPVKPNIETSCTMRVTRDEC